MDNKNKLAVDISEVIKNSDIRDRELKSLLDTLFSRLASFTEEKLYSLESSLARTEYCFDDPPYIYTALISNADLEAGKFPSFYPVVKSFGKINIYDEEEDGSSQEGFIGVFFDCSYDEFVEITDGSTFQRSYTVIIDGVSYECCFRTDYSFVVRENILNKLSAQYGLDVPMIYSPFSRRFAQLVFCDKEVQVKPSDIKQINFGQLDRYITATTASHSLAWNLKITENKPIPSFADNISESEREEIEKEQKTYTSSKYLITSENFRFRKVFKCSRNEYILFDNPENQRIAFGRNAADNNLFVMYNSESELNSDKRIEFDLPDKTELNELAAYQNYYDKGTYRKKRLNTIADINYALSSFSSNPYGIEFDDIIITKLQYECGGSERLISGYMDGHRYYSRVTVKNIMNEPDRQLPVHPRQLYCTIPFKSSRTFAEDFMRYVTEFLSEAYPEILWSALWRMQ